MMHLSVALICLLSLLLADAQHSRNVHVTNSKNPSNVLFLVGLVQKSDPRDFQRAHEADPNILLLYSDDVHSEQWNNRGITRTARGMNSEEHSSDQLTGEESPQPFNLIDMLLRSRRRLSSTHGNVPVPSMWLHPPPIAESAQSQQARSESPDKTTSMNTEEPIIGEHDSEATPPSTIMAIPDLLLDLGHMLTQPLFVDKSKNRESHEYGMIAKAPFIICPLGFQRDLLGNCRPVFRSRRGFVLSRIRLTLGMKENTPKEEHSSLIKWPEEEKDEAEHEVSWNTTTEPTANV